MSTSNHVASESPEYKVESYGCQQPDNCRAPENVRNYKRLCAHCGRIRNDAIRELVRSTDMTFDQIAERVGWSRRVVSDVARHIPKVLSAPREMTRDQQRANALGLPMLPSHVYGGKRFEVEEARP